jgi:hypothetical protein
MVVGSCGSTRDGRVSSPFAQRDSLNKLCAADTAARVVREERPGQTCLDELRAQNAYQQDGMLQEVRWPCRLHETCSPLVWDVEDAPPLACCLKVY